MKSFLKVVIFSFKVKNFEIINQLTIHMPILINGDCASN